MTAKWSGPVIGILRLLHPYLHLHSRVSGAHRKVLVVQGQLGHAGLRRLLYAHVAVYGLRAGGGGDPRRTRRPSGDPPVFHHGHHLVGGGPDQRVIPAGDGQGHALPRQEGRGPLGQGDGQRAHGLDRGLGLIRFFGLRALGDNKPQQGDYQKEGGAQEEPAGIPPPQQRGGDLHRSGRPAASALPLPGAIGASSIGGGIPSATF